MFHNARVLDIISFNGFWSLAALDAGAAHVVAVETSPGIAEAAAKNFTEYRIKRESYQFIQAKIMPTLKNFKPQQFDVILCKGFFEYCNLPEFFGHLSRLRPRHVVVDTKIAAGEGPLARFAIGRRAWEGSRGRIMSTPTHDLMAFLCESEFQWRLIDWQAMGITDWTGIPDYARGSQRTYVLDLLS
jgi:2-polyprenyl-3-methyl-5-hydroxy-6-metoxy-1,4-benzoquinol methylase